MAKNLDAKPAKLKVWLRLEEKEKIEALIYFIKKEPDCLDCLEAWAFVDTFLEEAAIRFLLGNTRVMQLEPRAFLIRLANGRPFQASRSGKCAFSKKPFGVGQMIVWDKESRLVGLATEAQKFLENIGLENNAIQMPEEMPKEETTPRSEDFLPGDDDDDDWDEDDDDDDDEDEDDEGSKQRSIKNKAKDIEKYCGSFEKMVVQLGMSTDDARRSSVVKRVMQGVVSRGDTCDRIIKLWFKLLEKEDFKQQLEKDGYVVLKS